MSEPEITIVDYGMGNLLSVQSGLEYCGARVSLTSDPQKISRASKIVLAGVGAYASGMKALNDLGLTDAIREASNRKTPLLGICLGMQLLLDEGEEFQLTPGIGLINGRVIAVPAQSVSGSGQKIPHIGWSTIDAMNGNIGWMGTLLEDNRPGDSVYFVHSFMAVPKTPHHIIAYCTYGGHRIAAAINKDHITGCQFHPEKSGEVGLKILRRFIFQ